MKHSISLLSFSYSKKKSLSLKKILFQTYSCKEIALSEVHNTHGISYIKENDGSFICCNFQFGWEPTRITFAIVSPVKKGNFGFTYDITNRHSIYRIKNLLNDLILVNQNNDYGGHESQYPDWSLKLSGWHWKYTMPKGYRILDPGETILETDWEYHDISTQNRMWMNLVSWYNVGKVVEKGNTWASIGKSGETLETGGGEPTPLICRKIAQ